VIAGTGYLDGIEGQRLVTKPTDAAATAKVTLTFGVFNEPHLVKASSDAGEETVIFAIGRSEIYLSWGKTLERIPFGEEIMAEDLRDIENKFRYPVDFGFHVEAKLPSNWASYQTAILRSFNLDGEVLMAPYGLGYTDRKIDLWRKEANERFSIHRSDVVALTNGARGEQEAPFLYYIPSEDIPEGIPSGVRVEVIQGVRGGAIQASLPLPPIELSPEVSQEQNSETKILTAKRVIIILIDGLKEEVIRENLDKLPNIRSIVKEGNEVKGFFFDKPEKRMRTIYPAGTYAAIPSLLTRAVPQLSGMYGPEGFMRIARYTTVYRIPLLDIQLAGEVYRNHFAFGEQGVKRISDFLGAWFFDALHHLLLKPTIFQDLDKIEKWSTVAPGFIAPPKKAEHIRRTPIFKPLLGHAKDVASFLSPRTLPRDAAKDLDSGMSGVLVSQIRAEGKDLNHFVFSHWAGLDRYIHGVGKGKSKTISEEQLRYVKDVIDKHVGEVLNELKEQGTFDETVIILTADHGMYHMAEKNNITFKTFKNILEENKKFDMLYHVGELQDACPIREGDFDTVVVFAGPFAGLYIRDKDTKDWKEPPDFDKEVMDAAKLLLKDKTLKDKIEMVLVRKTGEHYKVLVQTQEHPDTFKLQELKEYLKDKKLLTIDFIENITKMTNPFFSPDILLVAKFGEKIDKRFYFSRKGLLATHGAFVSLPREENQEEDSDAFIPFLIGFPGGTKHQKDFLRDNIGKYFGMVDKPSIIHASKLAYWIISQRK
jgi:hypothetical protein